MNFNSVLNTMYGAGKSALRMIGEAVTAVDTYNSSHIWDYDGYYELQEEYSAPAFELNLAVEDEIQQPQATQVMELPSDMEAM